jgi:hypothetical protein
MAADLTDFEYIAYIDEAGDPSIKRVQPIDPVGGTEWFGLGCVLIKAEKEARSVDYVRRVREAIGGRQSPILHYRHLKPWHRLTACKELATEDVRCFSVISNKRNMRGYRNPKAEGLSLRPNDWFYNYCIRLLLERISDWAERRSIIDHGSPKRIKLVFSKRGGHSYRHVETYAELLSIQIKKGDLYQTARAPKFSVLDHRLIEVVQHENNAGLQMADIVASAFYNAANDSVLKNWNTGPAMALKPRIASLDGHHKNQGLTLLPWRDTHRILSDRQKEIFRYYGYQI